MSPGSWSRFGSGQGACGHSSSARLGQSLLASLQKSLGTLARWKALPTGCAGLVQSLPTAGCLGGGGWQMCPGLQHPRPLSLFLSASGTRPCSLSCPVHADGAGSSTERVLEADPKHLAAALGAFCGSSLVPVLPSAQDNKNLGSFRRGRADTQRVLLSKSHEGSFNHRQLRTDAERTLPAILCPRGRARSWEWSQGTSRSQQKPSGRARILAVLPAAQGQALGPPASLLGLALAWVGHIFGLFF